MPPRLADRLSQARQRRFVGRAHELELFQETLHALELPFCVLHIFGPDGIGKTTLLGEYAFLCEQAQVAYCYVDARNVDTVPEAFLAALGQAMNTNDDPLELLGTSTTRYGVLIDTYETLAPLDGWFRDVFLPQLSAQVLVVFANRNPPALIWRTDPGWQSLVSITQLQNLSPEESRSYLALRNVPETQHQAILNFTHGYPLALSLVADLFAQRKHVQFRPEAAPDVIKTLLEQLVQKVPGPAHRAALEVCALVHITTEALLSDLLSMPDVHELFDWLRGLSFIESGQNGLFPHNMVREALDADVRWRNPEWHTELHQRARSYYANRLQQVSLKQQQSVLTDYVYLHRHSPMVRPFFEWQEGNTFVPDIARPADWPLLRATVAVHEGELAAQWADFWYARQPDSVLVLRGADGEPAGFVMMLALHEAEADDLATDPATAATWQYLQQHAPLRPGERATLFRFWMARESYQAVSAVQSLIFVNMVRHYLTTPGLAFTFIPCSEPEFWTAMFAYADLTRFEEADFSLDGRRYGVYGHDWRATPPMAWLSLMADRETTTDIEPAPPGPAKAALVVLNHDDFAEAVRDALRDMTRLDALQASPLLRARLVIDRAGAGTSSTERVDVLQTLIKEACKILDSPRDAKSYRALYHTYLQPAPTQEQAAELLDLPFSTFRRHLKAGITRVTEILWQWELQGMGV